MSLKIIRILQHGLQWYFLNIHKGACVFCFDKSIAIVTQLYNRNLSISNFQGNLTSQSFIIKVNDIYSMIILWLNLLVYNLKLDIIFSPFSCNFQDNFVKQGLLTMLIST